MKEPAKKQKSNLTYKEYAAMEELAKRKDLIIINADKGGAVVIMDTDSYIKEANHLLYDKASFKQLTQDPTLQHKRMVNQTIETQWTHTRRFAINLTTKFHMESSSKLHRF